MKIFVSVSVILAALSATANAQAFGFATQNGGTTGGGNATPVTVSDCSSLKKAVAGTTKAVVKIKGTIQNCGAVIDIGSNKSILGVGSNAALLSTGLRVKKSSNVIIRNIKFTPPKGGDALSLDKATNVWIDHNTFGSLGLVGGKDDFDGLLDITHASDWVTVSWNKFENHWKASLIGHSDSNASEDTGKFHVTYANNFWTNINSRAPSVRFGQAHIYNNYYDKVPASGVNSRMGAKCLVEGNVFNNVKLAIVTDLDSKTEGYATDRNNVFSGGSTKRITKTGAPSIPYSYSVASTSNIKNTVTAGAGVGKVTF